MNPKVLVFTVLLSACVSLQAQDTTPEYFMLRPDVEKAYGYAHAVKVGNTVKISGAVSMDAAGLPTAVAICGNRWLTFTPICDKYWRTTG
jgi:hypothetical protein